MTMLPVYGVPKLRSCQHCAAAKARCVPDYGSTRCQRCNERNIDCVLKEPTSRKRRKEGTNQSSSDCAASSTTYSRVTPMQISEVQRGVEYYRRSLCPWFPFVSLPNFRQPAVEFATQKPFLSLVIAMLGCIDDRSRQRELALESRKWLATHVMQDGEKSLDILQGLLLVTHWYTFQWELPNQRNLFMHLAMSLVIDLGLIRSPHAHQRVMTREEAAGAPDRRTALEHTLEQKRALLGCLYLSSA
ncbi:hypothetical protein DM02DRAFT_135479 [Periconia macrospinosa]|uniref:Zn(2)-C6 fungal-type domain-containing protein n=1 Tax=Periconia macrospinosa TaxID=97972 RepID=A0A2V1E6Y3_9PLEO|nr:hypothetical protein DM02DRAFT_135479 [Periconia macrospinosa]